MVEVEPVAFDHFGKAGAFFDAGRFDDEGVGAKLVSVMDVITPGGGGKDDDGQGRQAGGLAEPLQDFHAAFAREFDIKDDETGHVMASIGLAGDGGEVIDGLLAIGHDKNGIGDFGGGKGVLEEEDVIFVVVGVEDGCVAHV